MPKSLSLAVMLAIGAASLSTVAVSADGGTAQQPEKKKKPKKICKSSTQDTGSRITKRICKTQEEWDAVANDQELQVKSQGY